MNDEVIAAVAQNVLARRIGMAMIELAQVDARAQLAEARCAELEAELEARPARPAPSSSRRSRAET